MKLFWLFLLSSFGVFAQNDAWFLVSYKAENDFGIPFVQKNRLFFNSTEAFYKEGAAKMKGSVIQDTQAKVETNNIIVKKVGDFIRIDLKNNEFGNYNQISGKKYVTPEKLFAINWKIDRKSTKKIMNYECFKAEGSFRGRDYTVWFTEEIAVPFGPWKFNGLPGLILEVSDKLAEVNLFVEKIEKITENSFLERLLSEELADYQEVSYKEYLALKTEERDNWARAYFARRARENGTRSFKKEKTPPSGYELKYEWEE